jgi:hypothetical protein
VRPSGDGYRVSGHVIELEGGMGIVDQSRGVWVTWCLGHVVFGSRGVWVTISRTHLSREIYSRMEMSPVSKREV